jgi:hypothetical protein
VKKAAIMASSQVRDGVGPGRAHHGVATRPSRATTSSTTRTPASSRSPTPPRPGDEGAGRRVRDHGLRDRRNGAKLLRDMKTQGFEPEVIDGAAVLRPGAARPSPVPRASIRGAEHHPVRGGRRGRRRSRRTWTPTTRSAPRWTAPTGLGVQAFSAGLLFATAAPSRRRRPHPREAARPSSRRSTSGTAAASTSWRTRVIERERTCFMYMQVKDGAFVRYLPRGGRAPSSVRRELAPLRPPEKTSAAAPRWSN